MECGAHHCHAACATGHCHRRLQKGDNGITMSTNIGSGNRAASNQLNINTKEYYMSSQHPKAGEKFPATVKLVRPEGVYFEKRGDWSGCIAASFFGKGATREAALTKIHPGDTCEVEILAVHPGNRSLEFALAKGGKQAEPTSRKPSFAPCPEGTLFLFDLSNFLGAVAGRRGADWVDAIEKSLTASGYSVLFFVERRCLAWARHQQITDLDGDRILALGKRINRVTVISGRGEADLAILHVAAAVPGSVCISRDSFRDYEAAFPDIVGSNRVKSFTLANVSGKRVLSIDGVRDPISLEDPEPTPPVAEAESVETEPATPAVSTDKDTALADLADSTAADKGAFGGAVAWRPRHRRGAATHFYAKSARNDPNLFYALADQYAAGTEEERKLAAKYEKLAFQKEKRLREVKFRKMRQRAERRFLANA